MIQFRSSVAAAVAATLISVPAAAGVTIAVTQRPPGPAACHVQRVAGKQAAVVSPSGDAGWYWLPGAAGYRLFVCTDGVLVPVSGYGK